MKLVQDLPEIFEEFGEKKREAFLEITCNGSGSNPGRSLLFFK